MKFFVFSAMLISTVSFATEKPTCLSSGGQKGWSFIDENGRERFIKDSDCEQKTVVCYAISSRSEGWWSKALYPQKLFTCDSEFGKELLSNQPDRFICINNIVNEINYDLITYDNCSSQTL